MISGVVQIKETLILETEPFFTNDNNWLNLTFVK